MKKSILISAALLCGALATQGQEHAVISTRFLGTEAIPVSEIESITYEDETDETGIFLSNIIAKDKTATIYAAALKATGLADSLRKHMDYSYTVSEDSTNWTNDALVISTANEYDNVAYPKKRLHKYTAFIVQDQVLAEKYGITNLDNLCRLAKNIYDDVYPEDAHITDLTDRRNSLNRFISYHILNRLGTYYTLTCVDGPNSTLAVNWDRKNWDIADWYETMMPHSLMKFSFPQGVEAGLYINRRGVQARADYRGVFVPGTKVYEPEQVSINQTAANGVYHYIDDIVHYGRKTQEVVLNERLRFDATTLSPDFMNSGARGHYTFSNYEYGKYGLWDDTPNHNNRNICLGFKAGFVKNFDYDNATHLHVRPRTLSFWSYQGDEVIIKGIGDITFKLPSVPSGTYEIRIGTCLGFRSSGIRQFLLDGEVIRDNVDFLPSGRDTSIGWISDYELGSEEAINAHDAELRSRGWMKGPKSYYPANSESGGKKGDYSFRDISNTLRCIVGNFTTDGKTDHYLTIKLLEECGDAKFNLDYIELCPSSVYNNEFYPEEKW